MQEINAAGFLGKYDFLYLPMRGHRNRGLAFINFISTGAAEEFKLAFGGRRFRHFNKSKLLAIAPAHLQGFEENAAHYDAVFRSAKACGGWEPPAKHAPFFSRRLPRHLDDDCGSDIQHQQRDFSASSQDQVNQQVTMLRIGIAQPKQDLDGASSQVWAAPTTHSASPTQRIAQFCAYCGGRRSQEHRFCAFCGAPCNPSAGGMPQ